MVDKHYYSIYIPCHTEFWFVSFFCRNPGI